ncbi:MAG: hypothetical protein ACRDL7_03615 [Gaiellaceae bacterium]
MIDNKTAGSKYVEIKEKVQDQATAPEFVEAIGNDFMPKLLSMVESDKKKTDRDFFIEACISMHPLLPGTPQFFMISRHTCPTPFPDRAVFHYNRQKDELAFLWHVPSLKECQYYIENLFNLTEQERAAAQDVLSYRDGSLLQRAKQLNGEKFDDALIFYRKDTDGRQPITS